MADSKDVVVTGVSTGIGWGTTKVLVSKGFRVFGSVRKQADAERLQREFAEGFVPLMMDTTDADAVHQAAQKVGSMIDADRVDFHGPPPVLTSYVPRRGRGGGPYQLVSTPSTLRADVNQCVISVLFECKVEEEHEVLHKLNSAAS